MMMKLDEKRIKITNFYENISEAPMLNAANSFSVDSETEFPDLSELQGLEFQTCVITNDDNIRIPTQGLYKKVNGINVTYDDRSRVYTANIILG